MFALFLCLLMIVGCFSACGKRNDADENGSTTAGTDVSTEPNTENLYDENGFLKDHLPEADFGNTEFQVLAYSLPYTEYDLDINEVKDSIDAAVYRRNRAVEDRYNIYFNFIKAPGGFDHQADYNARIDNMSASGESYDMLGMYSMNAMSLAVRGYLADLLDADMTALDFSNPWWSSSLVEQNTITNKLFYATGDISVSYVKQMDVMVYNYDMGKKWSIDNDPVDDVRNDIWTFSRMLEYTKNVYQDLDFDNKKSANDSYGFIADEATYFDFFSSGFGFDGMYLKLDETGKLIKGNMFEASGKEYTTNIVNRMVQLFNDTNEWAGGSVKKDGFEDRAFGNTIKSGNALFTVSVTSGLTNGTFEYDFGILPCPKYDETQEEYYSIVTFPVVLYGVLKQTPNRTRSAIIMEALASEAHRRVVTPLYEEQVKTRYANRDTNREMFDLIRSRITISPTRLLFKDMSAVGTSITVIFRRKITENMDNIANNLEALDIQVENYLENTLMPAFLNQ